MNIREQIKKDVQMVISSRFTVESSQIEVTRTADVKFGDYSTNAALRLASQGKLSNHSPLEFANILADSKLVLGIKY